MMKMLNACTAEIDDVDLAVSEILEQLDVPGNLLNNSIGIIACYYEFIETGVVAEICKRLPFDVVGCTTLGNSVRGICGLELLSISVLTGDDVFFSSAISAPLDPADISSAVQGAYERALNGLKGDPAMILSYAPMMHSLGAVPILDTINRFGGGIPIFGTISCDSTATFRDCRTIYNGQATPDTLALVLLKGNVRPKFYVNTIPDENIQKLTGIITESDGCLVKRVNNMPFLDYLATTGLSKQGVIDSPSSFPIMINYNDNTKPACRALYMLTPEGYALLGGEAPVGAGVSIATMDYAGVLETAESAVKKAVASGVISGLLIYPCLSRNFILEANTDDEMKKIIETLGEHYPHQICYSGGEICPVSTGDGKLLNRIHNFTLVICAF
jgi:hypothetical protein